MTTTTAGVKINRTWRKEIKGTRQRLMFRENRNLIFSRIFLIFLFHFISFSQERFIWNFSFFSQRSKINFDSRTCARASNEIKKWSINFPPYYILPPPPLIDKKVTLWTFINVVFDVKVSTFSFLFFSSSKLNSLAYQPSNNNNINNGNRNKR